MPSILVYEKLMAAKYLTGDVRVPLEGTVLPDSYSYDRGERRQAVLDRMQRAMKETMSELWPRRSKDAVVKTPEEALTRSEEHTSELQSLMRISYAVFCLKKKNKPQ